MGEEHSHSGKDSILLLDLADEGRRSIKLTMSERWGSLVAQLGERLGQEPAATKRTWRGAAFDDAG